jgi:hypothetical protein
MKRKLMIVFAVSVLFGSLGYLVPRLVAASKARPLYGNFDIGLRCMGGHEIFLYLDETHAYENCPGHRDLDPMGPVVRTSDSLTILHSEDGTPWLRINYDGSRHMLTNAEKGWSKFLPQVANPWRTWLPKLLPEH